MGFFANRRNRLVEGYLNKMVEKDRTEANIGSLYFEAACQYAQDNGGKLYPDMRDSIIFDKVIGGKNYSIMFMVGRNRSGTNITVNQRQTAFEIAQQEAEQFVESVRSRSSDAQKSRMQKLVQESFTTKKVYRSREIGEKEIEEFFRSLKTPIPINYATESYGSVRLGILRVPEIGTVAVMAAMMNGEAIITAPGSINEDLITGKKDELISWQAETFQAFHDAITTDARGV